MTGRRGSCINRLISSLPSQMRRVCHARNNPRDWSRHDQFGHLDDRTLHLADSALIRVTSAGHPPGRPNCNEVARRVSGFDNSPDYGGPDPSWREGVVIVLALVDCRRRRAIWALRRLLLAWGLAW